VTRLHGYTLLLIVHIFQAFNMHASVRRRLPGLRTSPRFNIGKALYYRHHAQTMPGSPKMLVARGGRLARPEVEISSP